MKKTAAIILFTAALLSACGGGGGDSGQPTSKALTISMYGKPLVSASSGATAHAQLAAVARAASTPAAGASDAQATVQTLQDALAARGVTANVTAQVMDGTTLHQIVMGQNNGLPPTPDQFKTDPSEWMVVNFQLDDMVTPASDPAQQAALKQFIQDLTVFAQRAAVSGKAVFAVNPIPTCDTQYSAAMGLSSAMTEASNNGAPLRFIGEYGVAFLFGGPKVVAIASSPGIEHFGADCRTPDAYIQNIQIQSIADSIAAGYKEAAATSSAASGASSTGM
ncbi:hypothetical protein B0G81_4342 [Paraburkholderia sp. BL6665CI2N2]|uniref:hypothetical protein n=1 Tax=Paraburkholderia sp. BL6665CI2N2 TaxID=1938806 RepID=UPI001065B635|nr:hypothetical protein [Paraburkholderia sp. BL6665CI2N2]TDY23940.1 hypothetical protein B0G81_4342 [Paraburkholderia sp. BL6665CI2N2]